MKRLGALAVALALIAGAIFINQAIHDLQPEGLQMSQTMLWVRLPMQLIFIAWAYWMTRPGRSDA